MHLNFTITGFLGKLCARLIIKNHGTLVVLACHFVQNIYLKFYIKLNINEKIFLENFLEQMTGHFFKFIYFVE